MTKEPKEVIVNTSSNESSIVWGKVMVAQLTVLDKLIEGLEKGANIDHCLTLSNIYKNLCN